MTSSVPAAAASQDRKVRPVRSVFSEFTSYDQNIVPAAAGTTQREECRRAFYASAWALYWLMLEASADQDEEQCERNLQALHDELKGVTRDLAERVNG